MAHWGPNSTCPDPDAWDCGNGNTRDFKIIMLVFGILIASILICLCCAPVCECIHDCIRDSAQRRAARKREESEKKWVAMEMT